jgi:hypothetical protein
MMYTVRPGDSLSKIAARHGLADWHTIYYHENNAEFRRLRPDEDLIFPGDRLFIPDRGRRSAPARTGSEARFRAHRGAVTEREADEINTTYQFALYYEVSDRAFERAARWWERSTVVLDVISVVLGFRTKAEFLSLWSYLSANCGSGLIREAHVFSHASKGDETDGIEFSDNTLTRNNIADLPRLNWKPGATLVLHSCNTGVIGERGWTPAAEFAVSQGIFTIGQSGYAYFSETDHQYKESSSTATEMYLWAYQRRRNGFMGDGSKMPGVMFY